MKTSDLIWLGQRLSESARLEMRSHAPDVPTAELIVMRDLMDNRPSTITELAKRTGYAQSRVSTAVAGLVARGWVQTRSDPADGRRTLVVVPDDIRRAAGALMTGSEAHVLDILLDGRPPARRKAIAAALDELLDAFRQRERE